jgi:hypothetical protein
LALHLHFAKALDQEIDKALGASNKDQQDKTNYVREYPSYRHHYNRQENKKTSKTIQWSSPQP